MVYNNSSGVTHEVGTKSSNELGIYDMSGNVWEWCQDDWHGNYDGAPSDGNKWGDGTGSHRVAHGGSWFSRAAPCRVAARCCLSPDYGDNSIGFRVVRASSSK
jgi:formylglycine-generating enzyme required for sulfatase activity